MIALILNDTTITGYGLKVSCELSLPVDDLSGQSSSSAIAERGIKAKRLKVSLNIKYDDADVLSNIVLLSIATDETTTQRTIYNVNNQTANAFGVRQVYFADKVSAQEMDGTQAWSVSFVLVEYLSTSEKEEEQRDATTETTVASADSSVVAEVSSSTTVSSTTNVTSESSTSSTTTTTSSWIDKVMSQLNTSLSSES